MPDEPDERGVERSERRRSPVVSVLRDAEEEHAVPARPHVGAVAELMEKGRVPPPGVRLTVRLEPQEREDRREPDRRAAPEEDLDRLGARASHAQVRPCRAVLPKPLTDAHGASIISVTCARSRLQKRMPRSTRSARSRSGWSHTAV